MEQLHLCKANSIDLAKAPFNLTVQFCSRLLRVALQPYNFSLLRVAL